MVETPLPPLAPAQPERSRQSEGRPKRQNVVSLACSACRIRKSKVGGFSVAFLILGRSFSNTFPCSVMASSHAGAVSREAHNVNPMRIAITAANIT